MSNKQNSYFQIFDRRIRLCLLTFETIRRPFSWKSRKFFHASSRTDSDTSTTTHDKWKTRQDKSFGATAYV